MTYVIALIRLPLEVHPDGTFTAMNDNIDFEFIPIKELPPKKENGMELASIELDEIIGLFTNIKPKSSNTDKIIILDKIHKKRIRNKNTTFKNNTGIPKGFPRWGITHNYTSKSWK
jgi:hypothetical protein